MKSTVLVADEEPMLLEAIAYILERHGFDTLKASDGRSALELAQAQQPQIVLLSAALPSTLSVPVCCALYGSCPAPIILWSTSNREADKIRALDCGASDYLVKPFGIRELLARVEAVLRRVNAGREAAEYELRGGGLCLNTASCEVYIEGATGRREVSLSHKEFEVLHLLLQRGGQVVTREELMERVWGCACERDFEAARKTLNMHLFYLRRKLEPDPARPQVLVTVRGAGFRLKT